MIPFIHVGGNPIYGKSLPIGIPCSIVNMASVQGIKTMDSLFTFVIHCLFVNAKAANVLGVTSM